MGIKVACAGLILLGLNMVGMSIPALVVGMILIVGGVAVLVGY